MYTTGRRKPWIAVALGLLCGIRPAATAADPVVEFPDAEVQRAQAPDRPRTPASGVPSQPGRPVSTPAPPSSVPLRPPSPPSTVAPGGAVPPTAIRSSPALSEGVAFAPAMAAGGAYAGPGLTSLEQFSPGGLPPQMLGDQAPLFGPAQAGPRAGSTNAVRLPWARGYKMADNQSPWPIDRVFVAFSFYDNLNIGPTPSLSNVKVYREFFGLEKTFLPDRYASVGLRLPLNTISARSVTPGVGGASTALGDLTIFGKYALFFDRERGDVLMAGLAITPPTGPREFAGASFARARSPVYFQPFTGFVKNFGSWYAQGFSGINVPTDGRVVTMLYNDLGVGYYLYRSADPCRLLTSLVPAMEVHVNTPVNHRGTFSTVRDPGATFDVVDLTFGLSAVLRGRAVVSVGFVEPVTGPRPFDGEFVALLNYYFGGRRRGSTTTPPVPPPSIGP